MCLNPVLLERDGYPLPVPCGRCEPCLKVKRSSYYFRAYMTARHYKKFCFLTFTYDNESCPEFLDYRGFVKFLKRFRYYMKKVNRDYQYIFVGEYGKKNARPHYHLILFGLDHDGFERFMRLHFKDKLSILSRSTNTSFLVKDFWSGFIVCNKDSETNLNSLNYLLKYLTKPDVFIDDYIANTGLVDTYGYKSIKSRVFSSINFGFNDFFKKALQRNVQAGNYRFRIFKYWYSIPRYYMRKLTCLSQWLKTQYIKAMDLSHLSELYVQFVPILNSVKRSANKRSLIYEHFYDHVAHSFRAGFEDFLKLLKVYHFNNDLFKEVVTYV